MAAPMIPLWIMQVENVDQFSDFFLGNFLNCQALTDRLKKLNICWMVQVDRKARKDFCYGPDLQGTQCIFFFTVKSFSG